MSKRKRPFFIWLGVNIELGGPAHTPGCSLFPFTSACEHGAVSDGVGTSAFNAEGGVVVSFGPCVG